MVDIKTLLPELRAMVTDLAEDLLAFMGRQAIADSVRIPAWRAHIVAEREHVACRADRRRQ